MRNKRAKISIGFEGSFGLGGTGYWEIGKEALVSFEGSAVLGRGIQFVCNGMISIGSEFWCNADCIINASSEIKIGDYGLWGWRCCVLDGSGHKVLPYNTNESKLVEIGDHVWLASEVSILSGSKIGNDTIVAAKACISKKFQNPNLLLGGFNKVLKEEVTWEK